VSQAAPALGLVWLLVVPAAMAQQWPSFRGEHASGIADGQGPPLSWDGAEGRSVAWRTAIPGLGHSSPVLWGRRLLVTTAVSPGHDPYLRPGLYGESPDNPRTGSTSTASTASTR